MYHTSEIKSSLTYSHGVLKFVELFGLLNETDEDPHHIVELSGLGNDAGGGAGPESS